ncbi:MAG TPA: histidine--tRNA ligase [Acidimicrobiales bacterium]|nr:histidine--tRNA ligase [Acidimicrobiales bacterium]
MPAQFQTPPGTRDVLPPESGRWEDLVARFATLARGSGFGLIINPMFEDIGVFRPVGDSTDIVRKEMYDFRDKGDRHLALRPEGTASVARAFVQHRPTPPWKTWYVGPNFRYDKPQSGRYRQHHQVGVEAIGTADPDLDVEVISLASTFLVELGLRDVRLDLNSNGDPECKPALREAMFGFLDARVDQLCDDHREHYRLNPMRVLDCKRRACRDATKHAPRMIDHLCEPCATHFTHVRSGLDALGIAYEINTRLVRGQDYYTRTTFELAPAASDSSQNALGGGGRYDGLVEVLGGPPTPGIGFGLGIERILEAREEAGAAPPPVPSLVEVFVVDTTGGLQAAALVHELRAAGVATDRAYDSKSMKAQFKAADRSGAHYALIVGEDERAEGTVTVRDLRGGQEQTKVDRSKVVDEMRMKVS